MNYRYRMHWYADPEAPLNAGRPLFGDDPAKAVAYAARLWDEGAYAAATGYCVVDTESGEVLCRGQREPVAPARGFPKLPRFAASR